MSENAADESYVAFVEQSWVPYLRLTTLLCGDVHQAEELLQDCLVRLYARWRQVSRHGDPHAYLRRMLVNGRVSRWRRARRETLVADVPDRPASTGTSGELPEILTQALRALSRQQRAVLVLRYVADLSEKQVAEVLGCSVGSVKSQHFRALAKLRTVLPRPNLSTVEVP
jgi:RNA polymerase sigma-70 factor (sigma-E family)